ncbi:hypothetical protein QM012_007037 [Aureobasidium pullulans]|uniref:C2H2-type domain-containing protein n=1 Tax=Aureobasidium pullulans TaxID=5580 RepID=A0ABR0TN81_AURPU
MESSEQNPPPANDEVFYPTTTSAGMHWCYDWPSQPGTSALYHPQTNNHVSDYWTYYNDHPQSVNQTDLPPTPYSLEVWDPLCQRRTDYQSAGSAGVLSSSQVQLGVPLQIPNNRSHHHDEPSSAPWLPSLPSPAHTLTSDRRPSHHSDPGLAMNSQDNSGSQWHHDTRVNTGSDIAAPSELDSQGMEQHRSPSDTEPSTSAGPSPGSGQTVKPVIRCWDHGCDGRRFSSISNFRRHQRERAGQTPVCFCPRCGAAFYRRWTRDHHVERGSCLRIPRWS